MEVRGIMVTVDGDDEDGISEEFQQFLADNGYLFVRKVNGQVIGVLPFIFSVGIVCGIDEVGYTHRFCYKSLVHALLAFQEWDGVGEPGGDGFIKRKG